MKNLFRKTQTPQLETTIASLSKRGEQLSAKRVAAQTTLNMAVKARQHALLSADLDDQHALNNVQAAAATAASDLAGIDDALAVLAQQKTEAERQLAAEREGIKRTAAADKLAKQIASVEAALPGYLQHSRALAEALAEIGHHHFESGQIARYVQNAMSEIEVAANFALPDLKGISKAIREGHHAIPGEPVTTSEAVADPKPETQTVFMLRSAHYLDCEGHKKFAGQYEDAILPLATAQRALRERLAAPVTDPRRAQLRGVRGGDFSPNAPDVVDLDAANKTVPQIEPDPVLREANFTVIDRSAEAYTVEIAVPRT
ncbi:hypothetical protein [Bradyrhizobium australafricanum]|uniref:hypothetical protein n=1 Tax=Bradyrhizobium australafricanum TaxID=2821406 RepID=UPI001CE24DB0|nr:hypothetical protein [Bradyrhizobium australafricanum]MCA6097634.1 hypothetical protein [Bradyrhizobium australafricanum]